LLKPQSAEQTYLTKLAREAETLRRLGEDAILATKRIAPADAAAPDKGQALGLMRQLVTAVGEMVVKLRLAATEGSALADKVFSPTAGFEELPEEQAKALKELKKEKEKEEKAKAAQLQQMQQQRGGGAMRGYSRGRGSYGYQPYQVPAAFNPMMMASQASMQQQWPVQGMQGQQQMGAMMPQQGYMWHPDGYMAGMGRGRGAAFYKPDTRVVAKCYACGVLGHYAKDGMCLPGAREAFQAAQMQNLAAAAGAAPLALAGPSAGGGN